MTNKELQNTWNKKLDEALKSDADSEASERLKKVWPYLSGKRREVQIFELVAVWGFSQQRVGELLGISQQAVNKVLKKYFEKYPEKKPRVFLPRIGFLPEGLHVVEKKRL